VNNGGQVGAEVEPNYLYRNDGTGTFTKVLSGGPVEDLGRYTSAAWADYDNDGDPDLFVTDQRTDQPTDFTETKVTVPSRE